MRKVRDRLRRIDNSDGAVFMSLRDDLLYGEYNTGGIHGGSYRDNLGTTAEQGFKTLPIKVSVFVKVDIPQRRAGFSRNKLPWNKVCVVVGNRNDYFITGMELF